MDYSDCVTHGTLSALHTSTLDLAVFVEAMAGRVTLEDKHRRYYSTTAFVEAGVSTLFRILYLHSIRSVSS
jgi:hypothetical protein